MAVAEAVSNTMILFMWRLMMTKRIPMKGGDEYDGLTKARKFLIWKSGQLKKIKRAYNKRFRKHNKEIKMNNLLR
jgi:hypothetical protein